MDIVYINCPYCGGQVERKKDEYFANCPFCGGEVCFDEIKEEVQLGSYRETIDKLQTENKALEQNKQQADDAKIKLQKWTKARNITFAVMTLLNGIGFTMIGCTDDTESGLMNAGMALLLPAWFILVGGVLIFTFAYPDYYFPKEKLEGMNRFNLFLKLTVVAVALCLLSALVGYGIIGGFSE